MNVEIRSITPDELMTWRRAVRAGFGNAETSDDETDWVRDHHAPLDRALAAFEDGVIRATFRSFPNELTVPGGAQIPVGAVTAVTCQATHRRQGLLTGMMAHDLRSSADSGEVADVLIAAEYPIYGRFGYGPATQSTRWELDLRKARFTRPGSGTVEFIDNETLRKEAPEIFRRVRATRPGMIDRSETVWDMHADLQRPPEEKPWKGFRLLCRDDDSVPQGWANYKLKDDWADMVPNGTVEVADLCAATSDAEARLWRFLSELDLMTRLHAGDRPSDELLPLLLSDARAARELSRGDFLWVRLLDVPASLTARTYDAPGSIVIEVTDDQDIATGRYLLDVTEEGATCTRTEASADLTMPVRTLATAYLGDQPFARLHAAGWLDEETPGAVARADRIFATAAVPWCNTWF